MKIPIADDDALSRRLLEKTLQRANYEVTTVADGRHAIETLSQPDAPRLALLDWMMPELDGPGVCREIRKQREQSYVYMILLTSRESTEDIVEGLESGADDYLVKPFNAEELKARLRTGERILHLEDRGRYGGEEFLALLNNCPPASALVRAEEIRKAICTRPVQTDAGPLGMTMTLGVLLSSEWGHRPADELLRETDAALYAAKTAGRNRVMHAKPEESRQAMPAPQPAGERVR